MKRLFGVIAVLMGSAILLWIAYNLLIARQPETQDMNPILPLVMSVAMIWVGVMWVRGKQVGKKTERQDE